MIPGRVPHDGQIDWRAKGMPDVAAPVALGAAGALGWNVLDGRFVLPIMVVKRAALEHNIALLADYCDARGISLAPHGKTTMAPGIFRRQLAAGAWAISVATVSQARVAAANGAPRILIANEVVDDGGVAWLAATAAATSHEVFCYVDSIAGVAVLSRALDRVGASMPVLVEVGFVGGRGGVRSVSEAMDVATAVDAAPSLRLAGVAAFEGIIARPTATESVAAVRSLLELVRTVVTELDRSARWRSVPEVIVSAGGSQYVDLVASGLGPPWRLSAPVRLVVRSGCYATDDDGSCHATSPFGASAPPGAPRLRPAIEVWAPVISSPEPGLAIMGAGKRDLPYDDRMPIVRHLRRAGSLTLEAAPEVTVARLNDQHGYLATGGAGLAVGDLVGLGISHPCTAFDKWRLVPLVEEDYAVSDVLEILL